MKDKEKQIMELMKDKEFVKLVRLIDNTHPFYVETIALRVYEKYQPKLPENSVVITREEYDELQVGKDFDYGYHEGYKNTEAYYENFKLPKERKETATEILTHLKNRGIVGEYELNRLAEQYGVEL